MGYWLLHLMRFNGRINQAYKGICDNIWTNYDDLTAKSLDLGPKKWMNWCHALYFGVKSRGFHVYLSIYPSIYSSILSSIHPSMYLSIDRSIYLSVYLFVCLPICLFCMFVCLSIYQVSIQFFIISFVLRSCFLSTHSIYKRVVWNLFFPYIGNFIISTDELIFFRGLGQPPTRNGSSMIFHEIPSGNLTVCY